MSNLGLGIYPTPCCGTPYCDSFSPFTIGNSHFKGGRPFRSQKPISFVRPFPQKTQKLSLAL